MSAITVTFDERGLVPVVVQDRLTGEVRMVAWANDEALRHTRATKQATFWSRSRKELWVKGATSGNAMTVHEVLVDCDGDTLLYLVDPAGPSCHTGAANCFFRPLQADAGAGDAATQAARAPFALALGDTIRARREATGKKSYVKSLLEGGAALMGAKVREEADEVARAIADETDDRVASEAADVLFHLLVALEGRGLDLRAVLAVLAKRFGTGGHDEKAARADARH
jgi:phosphoribosyl-ATP pyrophosphohydrolase/phosphoribosyl-AMP cyclohydrolase